jgi:hypothetical protein
MFNTAKRQGFKADFLSKPVSVQVIADPPK